MPRSYDRRTFMARGLRTTAGAAALGGTGAVLDACGGGGSSSGSSDTNTTGGSGPPVTYNPNKHAQAGWGTGTPVRGGTLTIGTEADESGFDPTKVALDSTGVMYARTVYDPLAITLADGRIQPYLAESITPNADYTSWVITVRPNVLFHDGTACDGSALLFNMNAYLASPLVNFTLTYVDSVSQTGPRSITIKMKNPWVSFDAWLAGYIGGQIAYVFSPKAFNNKAKPMNQNPVGTGPFIFESWQPNIQFTAKANPHYWRKDSKGQPLPYLDGITFKPIPPVASRFSALQTGEIDLMHTDDDPTILQIRSLGSGYAYVEDDVITVGEPDMNFLMINTASTPFNDIRIRQAMAYSFDQKNYLQVICNHIAGPSNGLFPPGNEYHNPAGTGYPTYNPAKAKALVNAWMHDNGGQAPVIPYGVTPTPESERGRRDDLDVRHRRRLQGGTVHGSAGAAHRRRGARLLSRARVAPVRERRPGPQLCLLVQDCCGSARRRHRDELCPLPGRRRAGGPGPGPSDRRPGDPRRRLPGSRAPHLQGPAVHLHRPRRLERVRELQDPELEPPH